MELLVALQIVLKVTPIENFSLSFGMCQDMNDTRIAGLFSIHKLMVRDELPFMCKKSFLVVEWTLCKPMK